jgi:hypothetical protein
MIDGGTDDAIAETSGVRAKSVLHGQHQLAFGVGVIDDPASGP